MTDQTPALRGELVPSLPEQGQLILDRERVRRYSDADFRVFASEVLSWSKGGFKQIKAAIGIALAEAYHRWGEGKDYDNLFEAYRQVTEVDRKTLQRWRTKAAREALADKMSPNSNAIPAPVIAPIPPPSAEGERGQSDEGSLPPAPSSPAAQESPEPADVVAGEARSASTASAADKSGGDAFPSAASPSAPSQVAPGPSDAVPGVGAPGADPGMSGEANNASAAAPPATSPETEQSGSAEVSPPSPRPAAAPSSVSGRSRPVGAQGPPPGAPPAGLDFFTKATEVASAPERMWQNLDALPLQMIAKKATAEIKRRDGFANPVTTTVEPSGRPALENCDHPKAKRRNLGYGVLCEACQAVLVR